MHKTDFEKNILPVLPVGIGRELVRLCVSRGRELSEISELRVRTFGRSSIKISGECVALSANVSAEEIKQTVSLMCEGALYAYRDSIREGYISLPGGIRVGICGQARYERGNFIGVCNVSSLVFRIPTESSSHTEILYREWQRVSQGMLIYSPPGIGKTTALRSLVSLISRRDRLQVAVIDERCEFRAEDYGSAAVDIFRGYKRDEGMEIALRVMSPDVMVIDEIGKSGEARAMLESLNSGVKIIATAHAKELSELKKRVNLKPFFDNGIFDVFVGLALEDGERVAKAERVLC